MRSHAKASSAESIAGSGNDRSLLRRAFATLGLSREIEGSSARSFRLFCLAILAAALVPLIGPAGAKAAPGYQDIGGFGEFAIPGTPGDFAIDGDGNLLITNPNSNAVQVLDPAGNPIGSFGAGVLSRPYGIATDPANDLVYVSTEAVNESGVIRLGNAGSGTFTLSFKGNTTAALPYDATAAKVEAALEALPSIGTDNIDVYFGPGTYGYAFNGDLAGTEVPALGINGAALGAGGAALFIGGTPPNQIVKVISAAGGTFALGFDGQTTGPIAYNATPAALDSALEALSKVGAGNVSVAAGGPGEYSVTFEGALATTTKQLTAANNSLIPEAPKPEVTVEQEGGPSRIVRYESDGGSPPKFTFDPTYSGPVQGSSAGQIGNIASPLELDFTTGDLLVGDKGKKVVSRYDDSGALVDSYDGADSAGGAFKTILDLTAMPNGGTCVVADGAVGDFNTVSGSRVVCLAADGTATETLSGSAALGAARAIGYDAVNNRLVVGVRGGQFGEGGAGAVLHFTSGVLSGETLLGGSFQSGSIAFRIEGVPSGRVLVLQEGSGRILAPVFVPELDQPDQLTTTTAKLIGRVQADGKTGTRYRFEYSSDKGATWQTAVEGDVGPATPATVETTLTGLAPNFQYRARLAFTNEEGTAYSQVRTFSTVSSVPAVTTEKFADLTDTSVTFYGKVNPFGQQTTYYFEYGTTDAYGSRVPASNNVAAGQGRSPLTVSQSVAGLEPGTIYHYRLVAENATGTGVGEDRTFTTLGTGGAVKRAYELITPAEKGAASIRGVLNGGSTMQAGLDGEGISFGAFTQFDDSAQDAPYGNKWVAYRSPSGWTSYPADAPQIHPNGNWFPIQLTMGISEDVSKVVTMSLLPLAPGAVELQSNAYVKDPRAGTYTTIASVPGEEWWTRSQQFGLAESEFMFVNGSPDFDRVLVRTTSRPFMGAPKDALFMYENGQLRLISKAPDGTPIDGNGRSAFSHDLHNMSPDGSRVAFLSSALGNAAVINVDGQAKVMSESRRSGDPAGTYRNFVGESFAGGGVNLNEVYFFSHDLLDSSAPGVNYLYRYDPATEDLAQLAPGGDNPFYAQVSRDGSTIYWRSASALLPGAKEGVWNTYVWRNGEFDLVGPLPPGTNTYTWNLSPSGRYMVHTTTAPNYLDNVGKCSVGGNNDLPCHVVYRYDAETDESVCLSCLPDGGLNARPIPSIGPWKVDLNPFAYGHPVTDKGQVFFDTADQLVVADVNSKPDVYEYSDAAGVRLISSGTGEGANFADASLDGRDVFFTTNDKMVRADFDNSTDLYDARVGGGIPGQNDPPFSACAREDCRGQAPVPPPPPPGGSETTFGPGTKSARKGKSRKQACPKGRHKKKAASKSKAKARCVKKASKKSAKKNRGNDNRRQGR